MTTSRKNSSELGMDSTDAMSQTDAFNFSELQALTDSTPDSPLRLRTKLAFALVTMMGGLVIGTGGDTQSLPFIVVFFTVTGFVLVDWLKLFALPSVIAYSAMAIAGIYSVSGFLQNDMEVGSKMKAVAELLVIAQCILVLQEKTTRLFEQLMVFALLNCIVAAVFNDAFTYAIFFLPLALCSGMALALLAADTAVEQSRSPDQDPDHSPSKSHAAGSILAALSRKTQPKTKTTPAIDWSNLPAVTSLSRAGLQLPWLGGLFLFPPILLFATFFFFGLPRRVDASRGSSSEMAMVGFSDQLQLGQIREMQQSSQRAMRIDLVDPEEKTPYDVIGGLYIRGCVLENYSAGQNTSGNASWQAIQVMTKPPKPLPPRFSPTRSSDLNFFDRVNVQVQCESMRTPTLFAIAPYHWIPGSESLMDISGKWTISRINAGSALTDSVSGFSKYPRLNYGFGTHAFRNGIQTEWLAYQTPMLNLSDDGERLMDDLDYMDQVSEYSRLVVPSAEKIADKIVQAMPETKRVPYEIARQFERELALSREYKYSLMPGKPLQPGIDPIEQFLSTDKTGHCQFFASAMVMMLRSQNIPARLVVGYHTEEFSELGQYFIVRQNHAHVWVEALLDRKDIPLGTSVYGQPESDRYWMRLDPTPGGGGVEGLNLGGNQMLDLAQNLWDEYVIEMDSERQQTALLSTPGMAPMTASYRTWIERVRDVAMKINSGEVDGIGGGPLFSLPAAIAAIGLGLIAAVTLRVRLPRWLKRKLGRTRQTKAARPSLPFYAEALDLLSEIGIHRRPGQTPVELTHNLTANLAAGSKPGADPTSSTELQGPMTRLTNAFYERRYGRDADAVNETDRPIPVDVDNALQNLRQFVRAQSSNAQSSNAQSSRAQVK